jgi:hypothetical protein
MASPQVLIASRFENWGFIPFVLRELFEDPSPSNIAAALEEFCARSLGSRIARAEFFEASLGSAHGVLLRMDGAVIKLSAMPPVSRARCFGSRRGGSST